MCHCLAVTLHGLSIASQGNKKPTKKDTKMKEFVHTFHKFCIHMKTAVIHFPVIVS